MGAMPTRHLPPASLGGCEKKRLGATLVAMLSRVFAALGVGLMLTGVLLVPAEAAAGDGRKRSSSRADGKTGHRDRRVVPEIDAQHAGTAVALVAGGVAIALGRRRQRRNA